ncbi:unnamed protein product, partial [Musa acuminata subsp. burmannicoides]
WAWKKPEDRRGRFSPTRLLRSQRRHATAYRSPPRPSKIPTSLILQRTSSSPFTPAAGASAADASPAAVPSSLLPPPSSRLPSSSSPLAPPFSFSGPTLLSTSPPAAFFLVLLSSAFFLWPSDPVVTVTRFHLEDIRVTPPPLAAIGISLRVDLRVRNPDFFSLDHRSIVVSIGYRGRPLGSVTANGGHIKARGVSHVHAKLKIDGIPVWNDAIHLIEDLARRSLPLDTVTEVDGRMRLFFVDVPVQGKISCLVSVNPETREVINQDCYPE